MAKLTVVSGPPRRPVAELARFIASELRPQGKLLSPFNVIAGILVVVAAVILTVRFTQGLGAVTNLSQDHPWGLWIGFDVVTGVAFAGGAYVLTFMVYILGAKKYYPIVRVTVLNGFLAYVFYAGALVLDLGRPWNVINPIIGNSFGVSSVLFLVAWHFLLYMTAELVEFSPAIAEWLGLERIRKILGSLTVGAVIFGITLSTLHQSGLGALYMMAKGKVHPLWYSEYIPLLFFVSSIFAGLSMVVVESTISHRVFASRISPQQHAAMPGILLGLAKTCAGAMFVYFFLQVLAFIHGQRWSYLTTPLGWWYLLEMIGFVLAPCVLFVVAVRRSSFALTRLAAVMTLIGIILNRLNVSIIAYRWYELVRYVPTWMEIEVTLAVVALELVVFRWVVNRMPVLEQEHSWAMVRRGREESAKEVA